MHMKQFKEGIDYTFILPEEEKTTTLIRLLNGNFADTVFQYGKVAFDEQDNGDVFLKFIYNIVETPLNKEELENNIDFKNHIGDILVTIISNNINQGLLDESGNDYFEEPDTE